MAHARRFCTEVRSSGALRSGTRRVRCGAARATAAAGIQPCRLHVCPGLPRQHPAMPGMLMPRGGSHSLRVGLWCRRAVQREKEASYGAPAGCVVCYAPRQWAPGATGLRLSGQAS